MLPAISTLERTIGQKNQVSPGLLIADANGNATPDFTFQVRKPNGTLKKGDFPFNKLSNINDRKSQVVSDVNDVASSQGVVLENFLAMLLGDSNSSGRRCRMVF